MFTALFSNEGQRSIDYLKGCTIMLNIGVLGSGNGSNFQAIVDAAKRGEFEGRVCCAVSDVADAYILERASKAGIPGRHIDCGPSKSKAEGVGAEKIVEYMRGCDVDFVVLAGFMRIVKDPLLSEFSGRMINIHPSLLPAFPGLASWKQALEYGVKVAGCTVHYVDAGMDTGPIVLQRCIPVIDDDTPESLHARIQKAEHVAYPEALNLISSGRVEVAGRKVRIVKD